MAPVLAFWAAVISVPLAIILGYTIVTGRSRLQRGETVARLPRPGSGRVSLLPLVAMLDQPVRPVSPTDPIDYSAKYNEIC